MPDFREALGLDVGGKRIGIARVSSVARIPEPVCTLINDDSTHEAIKSLIEEFETDVLVVGLPRNLSGDDTQQTVFSREFADRLKVLGLEVVMQDEALSSKQAEELIRQGVYKRNARGDQASVDEVAACIILNDFTGEPTTNVQA